MSASLKLLHNSYLLQISISGVPVVEASDNIVPKNTSKGGSSRRAAGLQPSLKNVRQKIPPNSP